jgi:O-antigen/teichoic acid export membrane protein
LNTNSAAAYQRSRWLTGSGWLLINTFLVTGLAGATGIVLARNLGVRNFGVYSTITTAEALLLVLTMFRLDMHLATILRADSTDRREYGNVLQVAYFLTGPACAVGAAVAILVLSGSVLAAVLLGLVEVMVSPLCLSRVVLQVHMRQAAMIGPAVAGRVVWALAVAVVLLQDPRHPLPWIFVGRVVALVAEGILTSWSSRMPLLSWVWRDRISVHHGLEILRSTWPLALSGLAGVGYLRIDQILLQGLKGSEQTGLYAGAVRIAEMASFLPAIVQNVALPGLVQLHREGRGDALSRAADDALQLLLIPSGLLIAVLAGASGEIVTLVLGSAYAGSGSMLVVLAIADVGIFVGTVFTMVALAVGERAVLVLSTLAGLVVNISINLLLIGHWGGLAAAWASVAGYGVAACFTGILRAPTRHRVATLWSTLFKACLAIAIGTVCARAIRGGLDRRVLITTISYSFAVLVMFRRQVVRGWRALGRTRVRTRRGAL